MNQLPAPMQPGRISTAADLSYWVRVVSDEIQGRESAQEQTPDILFGLHAVLETALQKLRSGWYH